MGVVKRKKINTTEEKRNRKKYVNETHKNPTIKHLTNESITYTKINK
jgi:hypothetical protein